MIPKPYVARWQTYAPWKEFSQIEQDLLISRVLVMIFSDEFLSRNLAFRGGTALHKLYLQPASRYSEDIDLVQIHEGPIKPILQRLEEVINFFEEQRQTAIKGHGAKTLYRFSSEYENIRMRLKLEINCKEHFKVFDWVMLPFEIKNEWFTGSTNIRLYQINELLGTKLRALYQRSKGRDLFDLYYARSNDNFDVDQILYCFKKYISFTKDKRPPSKKEFLLNLKRKEQDPTFKGDMEALLRPQINYNQNEAFEWIKSEVIDRM